MSPQPQFELARMLTALYCVTMIDEEHAQTKFWSNFENYKLLWLP